MTVFEIHTMKFKDYRIIIKFSNNIEFVSKSFDSRVECLKMIRFFRNKSNLKNVYKIKNKKCGSWYFEFIYPGINGTLGRSNTYIDKHTVLKRINQMRIYVPKAKFNSKIRLS